MAVATVLVLPGGDPSARARLHGLVDRPGEGWNVVAVEPPPGPDDARVARICAAIVGLRPRPPLAVAACGAGAVLVPVVARALHAAHLRVEEYLLVRPELPVVTETWPDAPVTVVVDDPADPVAATTRLRGWSLLVGADPWQPRD